MLEIEKGVYRIATKMVLPPRQSCIDIWGASPYAGANVNICTFNDSIAQKVYISKWSELGFSNDNYAVQFLCSGFFLDVANAAIHPGANVWQANKLGSTAQQWIPSGEAVNDYIELAPAHYPTYRLDLINAITTDNNNIVVTRRNGSDAQKWLLIKDSVLDTSLGVCNEIGLTNTQQGTLVTSPTQNVGDHLWYPMWIAPAGEYQIRMRKRSRLLDTGAWNTWGEWSTLNGLTSDEGWGNAWAPSGVDTNASIYRYASALTNTMGANEDISEYQFMVRMCNSNGHQEYGLTHGSGVVGTVQIYRNINLSLGDLYYTPRGVSVSYICDYPKNIKQLTISIRSNTAAIINSYITTTLEPEGTIEIPNARLLSIPKPGELVTVSITYLSEDDRTFNYSFQKIVSFYSGHGDNIPVIYTDTDGDTIEVHFEDVAVLNEAYIVYDDGVETRLMPGKTLSPDTIVLYPPLHSDYEIYLVNQISDEVWNSTIVSRQAIVSEFPKGSYVWNYGINDYTCLALNVEYSHGCDRSHSTFLPSNSRSEIVSFGIPSTLAPSLSGVVVPSANISHSGYSDFERLRYADYAIFRTPAGEIMEVAIIATSYKVVRRDIYSYTITMKEVS